MTVRCAVRLGAGEVPAPGSFTRDEGLTMTTTETKHTPGPWGWENHPYNGEPIALTGGNDTDVLLATGTSGEAWLQVNEVDSRLIAAAPDMLDELRDTAVWLDSRADVLLKMLADPAGWRPGAAVEAKRQTLRDEAARLRGRALLIRQTITKATQGA